MYTRKTILLMALLSISVGLAAADDPLIGTWKLNLAKSKFDPGPAPKSQVNKYEPSGANGVKRIQDLVNAKGEASHSEVSYTFDGKDNLETVGRGFDSSMSRRMDANTTERIAKKDGKVVNTLRRVVSKDGKTMTVTQKGTDVQGKLFNNLEIYDKQ